MYVSRSELGTKGMFPDFIQYFKVICILSITYLLNAKQKNSNRAAAPERPMYVLLQSNNHIL